MFTRRLKGLFRAEPTRKLRWIVVASQSETRVFEQIGSTPMLHLVTSLEHPEGRLLSHEVKEGKPGRSFSSRGGHRHAMETEVSPHAQEATNFARVIGDFLERGQEGKRYDELILVAEPHFLGLIEGNLSKRVKRHLVARLGKDLAHQRAEQILESVQEASRVAS